MQKIFSFNNGLLTDVSTSGSERNFKKRCTFKNGILTNVVDTAVPVTGFRSLSFKNGLLTNIGGEVVSQGVYLGLETTQSISATWESSIIFDIYRNNYTIFSQSYAVGFILAFKDISYYTIGSGFQNANSTIRVEGYPPTLTNTPLVDYNQSYIFRPSVDDSWWETLEIKNQLYALVDDITPLDVNHYTHYGVWCQDLLDGGNHIIRLEITVDKYHYEVTYFWTPIYYVP